MKTRKPHRKKPTIRTERYEQILNDVAEEWADLGDAEFASKPELCMCIEKLMKELDIYKEEIRTRDGLWKNRLLNLIVS